MKKLKYPKILIAAGVIVVAIVIFLMVMGGVDSNVATSGHGHAH